MTQAPTMNYNPPWYLRNGTLQTVLPNLLPPSNKKVLSELHEVEVEPGHSVVLYESIPEKSANNGQTVLIIHPMGSSASNPSMVRTASELVKDGYRVFRMNHRGVGRGVKLSDQIYHGGRYRDIDQVLQFVATRTHTQPSILAFSLSSNISVGALITGANKQLCQRLVAISPVFDLKQSAQAISDSKIINSGILKSLKNYCDRRSSEYPDAASPDWSKISNMAEFDNRFVAPLLGYSSANDYYQDISMKDQLSKIQTPTFLLTAQDDPIAPFERATNLNSEYVVHTNLKHGGHLGFSGKEHNKRWIDQWILQALEAH